MLRARRSASRRASSSTWRTSLAISWRASSSVCLSSISLACAALRPEMRSSWIIASACALLSSSDMRWLLASRSRMDCSRRSCSAPRASMASSRCSMRCSALVSSSRRSRSSASTSLRTRCTSSLASRRASLTMVSASRRESLRSFSASRSAPASLLEARLRRMKYPTAMPTTRPTTMYTAIIISQSLHRSRGTKKAGQRARPVPRSHVHDDTVIAAVTTPRGQDDCRFVKPPKSLIVDPWSIGSASIGAWAPSVSLCKSESGIHKARAHVACSDST